jgi:hypothetical protein
MRNARRRNKRDARLTGKSSNLEKSIPCQDGLAGQRLHATHPMDRFSLAIEEGINLKVPAEGVLPTEP